MNAPLAPPKNGNHQGVALARNMGLFSLIVYGVGDMVGAGIYGTIGKAAQSMGNAVWLAFVGSMIAAMFTGLSYASLASRYPRAAGAAYITQRAYRFAILSYIVGLAVTASGLTSMATSSNVFSDNFVKFAADVATQVPWLNWALPLLKFVDPWMVMFLFIAALSYVNFRGIRESMWVNLLCTVVEVGGLLFVIAVGMRFWGSVDYLQTPIDPAADAGRQQLNLWLISSGAVLTFFSFIGFEDMLNVSEEVKRPEFNVPWGIVIALAIATVLYLAVAITAVSVVDYRDLGNTELGAPLQQITKKAAPWLPAWIYGFITLFAVANTVLINYIMGSRLLFGMARQGLLPPVLGRVHEKRRTPHIAIVVLMVIVICLAMVRNISQLAAATSLLLLCVFCIINAALVVLKLRPGEARGQFEVPLVVPILGVLACFGLITSRLSAIGQDQNWIGVVIAVVIVVVAALLYLITQPTAIDDEPKLKAEHS